MRPVKALAVLAVVLGLMACEAEDDRGGFGTQPAPPSSSASASPTGEAPEVRSLEVSAVPGPAYSPGTLRAGPGEVVEIVLSNEDDQDHTFVVDDLPVLILASAGQIVRTQVPIHPDRRGRFPYYCQIDGHRAQGMEGTLRVSGRR
jgi:plastocyanin